MNKAIIFILSILIVSVNVFAQTGNDFDITQNRQGGITITGYTGKIKDVIIPSTIEGIKVTEIGEKAFFENKNITSVTIPNGITSIGYSAFGYCTSLTSVTIPNSIKIIKTATFDNCTNLASVTIPNSVINIEFIAFQCCTSLTSITIPDSVTSIGEYAFNGCSVLTNITIGNSVTDIGVAAFYQCSNLTSINIRNNVTSIGGNAFPNNFEDFYVSQGKKAGTYLWSGRIWKIATAAEAEQSRKENEAKSYYNSGKTALDKGDYNKAIADFTQALRLDSSNALYKEQLENAQARTGRLTIWSFTDELANMINNSTWGFKATHPGVTVEYSQTPSDQFQAKIDPVLAVGQGAPDIIALESAFVRKYVESGLLLDITDIYNANKNKLLAYPVEIGTYQGKVYAMSWQACPGAMFYRRSLAKKYLGTDDPKVVQTYFSDFNKFLETANKLKANSNGACVVVSSLNDLRNPFLYTRKDPWIVNGKVVVDPAMEKYLDIGKTLHDNHLEGGVEQWSEGWFAGMRGELKDENEKHLEVFSYFLPTWGLPYVLRSNAPSTSGDWAMIKGPSSYRWGGTWIGAYKGTKNVAAVKEFIRYVTTDDAFLDAWAKDTGDLVSNINVINKIKNNYSHPYLGGQNHYAEFAEIVKAVNGKLDQASDEAIEALFDEAANAYWNGKKTKAQAIADFKAKAEAQFGR